MATQPGPAAQGAQAAQVIELLKLRLLCTGRAERRASERWPVELPLEGWLQLEGEATPGEPDPAIPVDLVDLSSGGVQVVLAADQPVRPGQQGVLITQAHGGGCGRRPVRCCWQKPHPQQGQLQCLGLAFE